MQVSSLTIRQERSGQAEKDLCHTRQFRKAGQACRHTFTHMHTCTHPLLYFFRSTLFCYWPTVGIINRLEKDYSVNPLQGCFCSRLCNVSQREVAVPQPINHNRWMMRVINPSLNQHHLKCPEELNKQAEKGKITPRFCMPYVKVIFSSHFSEQAEDWVCNWLRKTRAVTSISFSKALTLYWRFSCPWSKAQ